MKRNNTFNTIVTVAFVLLAFVLLILMSAGISLEFDRLGEWNYWLNIFVRLAIMLLLYNVIFTFDLQKRKCEPNTAHYLAVATKQMRVNKIRRERLFAQLGEAVELENKERYSNLCTSLINKVCVRLSYEDLPQEKCDLDDWLKEKQEELFLEDKDLIKIKRVALKILNGKVKYDKFKPNDILDMGGDGNIKNDAITFHSSNVIRKQNIIKASMFLLGVIAMTVFRYHPAWTDVVFDIIINSTLLVGATYSAILNSKVYLKRKTTVYEVQNDFLANRMGLVEEYNKV